MATKKLTKADILAVEDRPTEDVDVPEWGGEVTIRALSGAEREKWELSMAKLSVGKDGELTKTPTLEGSTVRLLALSIVDESGEPMFTKADIAGLAAKSATALDRVSKAAMRLNGLSDEAVEDEAKNSETTPNSEPGTD